MRAKITRLLAALMAVIMVLSFAACNVNEEEETTTKAGDDVVATEVVTDDEGEVVTDKDGEEVTVIVEDESSEDDKTTKADDKTTTKKDDKTSTKKDDKTTTKKDDKTTTKKDDKTTTKKDDKTTKPSTTKPSTTKPSTTKPTEKIPSTDAEILNLYKDAVAKVNSSKAGYSKTRSSTSSKFNVPGAFAAFKGMIEGFMGLGSGNAYTQTVAKGSFGGKIKKDANDKDQTYFFLTNVKLTTSDIKSADCKKSGDNYIITITLKDGTSQAGNGISTKNNSPLDRSGLCVGDRDIDIFDHKTAEIMYSAIEGTAKKTTVTESTSNAKIVATVNASSKKLSNLKITFDLECNMKVNFLGNHNIDAAGTTTVEYKSFKW